MRRIEEKTLTESVLAPKKVTLSLKDVSVLDAVAELAKQSGYDVQVEGNRDALAKRKITLETGQVTFFQALDQLCAVGGLVEKVQAGANPPGFGRPGKRIGAGFQPVPAVRVPGIPGPPPIPNPLQPVPKVAPPGIAPPDIPMFPRDVAPDIKKRIEKIQQGLPQDNPPFDLLPLPVPPAPRQNGGPVLPNALKQKIEADKQAIDAQMLLMQVQLQQMQQLQLQQIQQIQQIPANRTAEDKSLGGRFRPRRPLPPMIQPMPIQMVQPGFQIQGRGGMQNQPSQFNPQQIVLIDGKPLTVPTSYAGAVRVRLLPPASVKMQAQPGEVLLIFEVSAEPRLKVFRPQGVTNILAKDNQGQSLMLADFNASPLNSLQRRIIPVRLKLGDQKAQLIQELKGNISVEVVLPAEPVMTIDNVLQAKGQTVKGKNNDTMTLENIEKIGENGYRIEFSIQGENQNGNQNVAVWQIGIGVQMPVADDFPPSTELPNLVDAQGRVYQLVHSRSSKSFVVNGAGKQTYVAEYRADAGQGDPSRLVLSQPRFTNIAVPFEFKDVPLP